MPIQPQTFTPLLQVFYFGLTYGIVSKQYVAAWADGVIVTEDEPDYFFIELSTASDKNELMSIISNAIDTALTQLSARAVLGLIWHRYEAEAIDVEKAIDLSKILSKLDVLSGAEENDIYDIVSDFFPYGLRDEEFEVNRLESAIQFLSVYRVFRLDNFTDWEEINAHVDRSLYDKVIAYEQRVRRWRIEQEKEKVIYEKDVRSYTIISYSLAAVAFFFAMLGYDRWDKYQPTSELYWIIWVVSVLYFMFFVCYHIVLSIRFVLRKMFSDHF